MVAFPPGPFTSMGLWVDRAESFRAMGLKLGVYSTLPGGGQRSVGRGGDAGVSGAIGGWGRAGGAGEMQGMGGSFERKETREHTKVKGRNWVNFYHCFSFWRRTRHERSAAKITAHCSFVPVPDFQISMSCGTGTGHVLIRFYDCTLIAIKRQTHKNKASTLWKPSVKMATLSKAK